MENLENEVLETAVEAVGTQACPIKRALPVVAIIAVGVGVMFLGKRLVKSIKAKKAAKETISTEEVNPEQSN